MDRRRARVLVAAAVVAAALLALVLTSVRGGLVYYMTPQELLQSGDRLTGRAIRLGGFVVPGSLRWNPETLEARFLLQDEPARGGATVAVRHRGAPPQLFREGKGAVVEGRWNGSAFESTTILVKHDEEYRPPGQRPGAGAGD